MLALAAVILLGFQSMFIHDTLDDAFISFRYASNLIHHHELNWNPGEAHVEGYTNFLWVVLSVIPLALGVDVMVFMKILGCVLGLGTLICLYQTTLLVQKGFAWIPSLLLSLCYPFAIWSVLGMETPLFAFLLVLSVQLFIQQTQTRFRSSSSIALLFLSLTRPEGAMVFGISLAFRFLILLGQGRVRQEMSGLIKWTAVFILPYLGYMVWRQAYYGCLFPNTFYVKKSLLGGMDYVLEVARTYLPFIVIEAVCIVRNLKASYRLGLLYIGAIQLGLTVVVLNIDPIQGAYHRFMIPSIVFLYLFASFPLNERFAQKKPLRLAFLMLCLAAFVKTSTSQFPLDYMLVKTYSHNMAVNVGLGRSLKGSGMTLALGDCGAIPFYSELRTIDLFALNDLRIARQGFDVDYVLDQKPDLIILRSKSARVLDPVDDESEAMAKSARFRQEYERTDVRTDESLRGEALHYYWIVQPITRPRARSVSSGASSKASSP